MMDSSSEKLINVWGLLRDPIVKFYQEGMHKETLDGILSIINESCKFKKYWYIPCTEDFVQGEGEFKACQEEQHTAFCTWLLGKLFCILGRESLSDVHSACVKAQMTILQVCAENRFMIRFFFLEYLTCLTDLLELQTSESLHIDGPQLLRRFTPLPSKALEDLNLTPKYILVKSYTHVSNLQKYVVEILDSMVPNIVHLHEDLIDKCWFVLCKITQLATPHLKLIVLNTFSKTIAACGCYSRTALAELCNTLKFITQGIPNHLLAKSESIVVQDLILCIGNLVNVIVSCGNGTCDTTRVRDLITILYTVIFLWDKEGKKMSEFEAACNNVAILLDALPHGSINVANFDFLMKRYETQENAIKILEKCIFHEVVNHMKSMEENKTMCRHETDPEKETRSFEPTYVDAASSIPLWQSLNHQLWEDVSSIQINFPAEPSKEKFQKVRDLVGRVMSIVRCAVGVDLLCSSNLEFQRLKVSFHFLQGKVTELLSFLQFLLLQLVTKKQSGYPVLFSESIFKSIILCVRFLFLLPEVKIASHSELVCSILALPWVELDLKNYLKVDEQVAVIQNLYPEVQSEDLKTASMYALTNFQYDDAHLWKSSLFRRIIDGWQDHTLLAVETIKSLPVLLMDGTIEPAELLHDILFPTLATGNERILTAVSEVFSSIVCILSGDAVAVNILGKNFTPVRSHVCLTCQKDFKGTPAGVMNKLTRFQDSLSKFMILLTSPFVPVRRNMTASLGSLVLHLPSMYKPETVSTLMKYAEDVDHQVRLTFSKMVKFIIFSRDWMEGKEVESEHLREEHIPLTQVDRVELSHSRPRLDRVLKMLFNALHSRLNKKNSAEASVQDTLMETIVDIGCVPLDCVLLPVLKIVLVCVSHPSFSHPSLGQVYLKRIAIAHNTNVRNLYHRFQSDICQVLVSVMGLNFHARKLWTKFFDKVVYSFEFESTSVWLRQSLHCVVPSLMVFVIKFKDTALLDKVIELLRCSEAALVKECFQFIYPYAYLNESNEIFEKCMKAMEKMSGMKADELVISSFKTIHNELLLHYHCKKGRVEEGICHLISILDKKEGKSEKPTPPQSTDIAKHLEARFLGVLLHYDSLLESPNAEESNKIKALQSLPQIIRLMGLKYITPVRFKVLSTLRTALRLTHCDFPHLSCGAWEAFIQSVEIQELGPLLGTVVASILPLLDQFPDETSSMLEWLVVKHENELSEHIPDLFFLPNSPVIQNIYRIVQGHVTIKRSFYNDSQNLADYLQQPLRFIMHDNVDMRRHGLQYLLSLLKEKQNQFTKALLHEEVVHDDVAQLLSLLIEGCRDADQDIRMLCVENLGTLGALDPGHLPHKKPKIGMPQILTVDEDEFAVQALTTLAKAYQAARNTRNLDSFAVAIQALLRTFGISPHPFQPKRNLWESFPVSIQQVMAPLENSSYYMTSLQADHVWPHPLFGTHHASTLSHWAHAWACRIVAFIEDTKAKDLFTVCIPSLRRDINCSLFFLPFLLLYAVISGQEEQHKTMAEEMTYIIQQRSLQDEGVVETDRTSTERFQICLDQCAISPPSADSDSATHVLCAKTVFTLLDFLEKWVGWSRKQKEEKEKDLGAHSSKAQSKNNVQNVLKFLSQFSKLDLAYGNYGVKEYSRALMYLEDYLMDRQELIKNQEHLSFLGRIYAQMNEPDGIKGVLAIQCSQPQLLEAVVYHEVADQHQAALACYELLGKQHSNEALGLGIQKGIIRCCLGLDQPYAASHVAEGAILKRPESRIAFLEAQAECFWRIHNFENLEAVLKDPKLEDSTAWGVNIGRCLMDIRHNNQTSLKEHLCVTRSSISKALSTASLENKSYLQGYPHVIKLHMLQELEEASKVIVMIRSVDVTEQTCLSAIQNLVKVWEDRLDLMQATCSVQEPVLRLRRCLLQLASSCIKDDKHSLSALVGQELGASWLKSAEVARIGKRLQQAYIYLLNAEKYKSKRHFIELAKLHWQKNEEDLALATLSRGLDEHFPNSKKLFASISPDSLLDDRKICAEAKLLVARYNDESMNVDVDINVANYKEAVDVYQQWEKSHTNLAEYYDRMSLNSNKDAAEFQMRAIISYTKALRYGCSLIYHNMSRMLTIWLDFGKTYHQSLSSNSTVAKEMTDRKTSLDQMNKFIGSHVNVLQAYIYMTGFSQLVSRICHPVEDVYRVIKSIIVKLLLNYPQQTMWMLLAVNRSSYPLRKTRCQTILEDPHIKRSPALMQIIGDFQKLGKQLTDLCCTPLNKSIQTTSVSAIVKHLPKLLADHSFSSIIVPQQRSLTLTLPPQDPSSVPNYLPFPLKTPFIAGIKEEVIVLGSLQRPRKITFRGSDGLCYEMMCKDKDDLRLDARVMEFNSIVNKCLQKDPASRSCSLNIRTYSVVPLNEECGLIEWVPNLNAIRIIIADLYKQMGCFTSTRELKKYILEKTASLQEKRDVFLKRLLPRHPPVFRKWFRNNFTDSRSWFEARKSYVHTTAVMSMVGYILGLGDRHGENILLDTTCGDVVHVDFNCLFNKGDLFECPERVPFRLTHNMVTAMGPTGVEGPFRSACEITLRMLREMRGTLLSVLQPFVYDPKIDDSLVGGARKNLASKKNQSEMTNDSAVENVHNIDLRLNGMMKKGKEKCTLQLSVEGQAAFLIQEARNIDNLCQMYIGWGAYI